MRATMFAWGDKGICYFLGEGADARIVRAANIDALQAEPRTARAPSGIRRADVLHAAAT